MDHTVDATAVVATHAGVRIVHKEKPVVRKISLARTRRVRICRALSWRRRYFASGQRRVHHSVAEVDFTIDIVIVHNHGIANILERRLVKRVSHASETLAPRAATTIVTRVKGRDARHELLPLPLLQRLLMRAKRSRIQVDFRLMKVIHPVCLLLRDWSHHGAVTHGDLRHISNRAKRSLRGLR